MWQKINESADNLARTLRSLSRLIASTLMLAGTCGLVWAIYKGVLYAYATRPWWLKVLGL